jgi:tetratricopeptide (TPR) repeat protein
VPLKEWQAIYQADGLRDMPLALAGMVTGTLSLSPLVPVATVNAAAYPFFVRGVGLLERNSMDEALPLLQSAVKADPDSPLTYARLAEAQHGKYQVIRDARGSGGDEWLQMAKASLAQAEIRNPDLAVVRAVSGMINKYEGAYEKAEVDYLRALQIEPLNSDVWRRLGDVYHDLSRFSEAVSAYQRAVDLQPGYFKNHQALCRLQSDQANYEEALRECQAMVVFVPQLSEAHFALGGVYLAAGRYAEGEQELRSALNLDPQSSKAYHVLALAMVFQKRYSEAIASFQRALDIGPESEQLYLNLGTTYLLADLRQDAQVSYQKALTIADKVLGRNPRERVLRSHVAYLCARLGQRSRAETEAAQALRFAPGSVEVARVIVQTYEVLGEREKALELAGSLPDEMLRRLNRSPDSADLPKDPRFQELLRSRHIQ